MARLEDLGAEDRQQRLSRLFRYAQVGRCVNSVTHDVNNYLGAIMAYAELVGLDAGLADDSRRMLNEVVGAVKKSSDLVTALTDIARKEKPDVRVISPVQLMERVLDLRRYEMKVGKVEHETAYDSVEHTLTVDLPKIQLALMYILSNAIEALEEVDDKRIRISLRQAKEGAEFICWDSGLQLPNDVSANLFEPFFTTKSGFHIGLGLTIAREVAQLHDGTLKYSDKEGFVLYLPFENSLS